MLLSKYGSVSDADQFRLLGNQHIDDYDDEISDDNNILVEEEGKKKKKRKKKKRNKNKNL